MSLPGNEFDAIIVGAGPGGATAAYYLANESGLKGLGLRVALLEKSCFPRDKYCGDVWCAPARDILEDMGVLQEIVSEGLFKETSTGGFVSPNGENYLKGADSNAAASAESRPITIKRMICDERIARRAAEAGATLIEAAHVTAAELGADDMWRVRCADGREFRCRLLLAADGAMSKLARSLGIVTTPPEAAAVRQYVKGGTHNFKADGVILSPEYILPGYVALFRHYDDDINLGFYIIPGGTAKVEDIARIHEEKILNDPFIQRALGPDVIYAEPVRTAALRLGGVPRSSAKQFMVIGDAAGQIDPLTGAGIHTAMISGRLAAQRAIEMFASKNFDEAQCAVYHQRWMEAFGNDFKSSAIGVQWSYRYPYVLDAAASLAQRTGDSFMTEFGAIMTGVKPKSTYARPDIAFPLSWEMGKQFFKQKVLRRSSGWASYVRHATENTSRSSAFGTVCLKDDRITAPEVRQAWTERNQVNPAEELFAHASNVPEAHRILMLYGSEYGFCKTTALRFAEDMSDKTVGGAPLSIRVLDLSAHELIDWQREPVILLVCATAGDGDVPENARRFFKWLGMTAARLNGVGYMVLACGDTAYPNFCKAGYRLDGLLDAVGARRLLPVHTVDNKDEADISRWFAAVPPQLEHHAQAASGWQPQGAETDYLHAAAFAYYASREHMERISPEHPCRARIVARTALTSPNAESQTVSVLISLRDFPDTRRMDWQPGDALGVLPHNAPKLVEQILEISGLDPDSPVDVANSSTTLKEALLTRLDIKLLSSQQVEFFVARILDADEQAAWQRHVERHDDSRAAARSYAAEHELIDMFMDFPSTTRGFVPNDWPALLPLLEPRFYSISSSPLEDAEQMVLTIAVVRYDLHGRPREGIASTYLAERLGENEELDVFLQANKDFRPPSLDAPVGCVMVGPGTGVAPFRGFVRHFAKQAEAAGKTLAEVWPEGDQPLLFFGCRHPEKDFLYADEWQDLAQSGAIRLVTAFSRTQVRKIYVQDRLRENSKLIWDRFERGAHFFICGDAKHMAGDVEQVLLEIIASEGGRTDEEARTYLETVAAAGRYQKDVWA
ncbi:Conditioned medium factor receptor 1 (modular protein) [Sterolibacterium denitrificans]|uniref:assimilatory sulfite reductase (NADPH) n=1 Tax=Sterolibacterium denitrificans TaxID=157592 RepID=A0A7Z7MV95_9PROT|nr:flavodoxin domain-containing protein [Sterolibacterium denitrificans]SMB26542.1 Conditioned medium factor receptor 1 (modular protein) [Sterolibacterium denitrificans]